MRFRFMPSLLRSAVIAALLGVVAAQADLRAQTPPRWTVDPGTSLAWWQVNPHLNHLWATTCPEEPSWRPGEGRSAGWNIDPGLKPPKHGYAGVSDTTLVPLYPRIEVLPICTEAVDGYVIVQDTATWRGVRGQITVRGDALVTGHRYRDTYAREAVLQTQRYREIRFRLDSLVDVTREADTVFAKGHGRFTLRHISQPVVSTMQFWKVEDGIRVLARFRVPAQELVTVWGLSKRALGLGIGVAIWQHLYMGVDMVLRPAAAPAIPTY